MSVLEHLSGKLVVVTTKALPSGDIHLHVSNTKGGTEVIPFPKGHTQHREIRNLVPGQEIELSGYGGRVAHTVLIGPRPRG